MRNPLVPNLVAVAPLSGHFQFSGHVFELLKNLLNGVGTVSAY